MLCLLSSEVQAQQEAPASAVWEVADRFRLFSEAGDEAQGRIEALMDRLAAHGPGVPLSEHHGAFLHALGYANGASLRVSNYQPVGRRSRYGSGRYSRAYLYPEHYRVSVRLADPRLAGRMCRWRTAHDAVERPCSETPEIRVGPGGPLAEGWGVDTMLHLAVDGGPERPAARIAFRDMLVFAMGDSYISGEGNPDVPSVVTDRPLPVFEHASWGDKLRYERGDYRPAEWWDEPCHRSLLSWPVLASIAYAAHHPRQAVTLVHVGCSGAVVDDLIVRGEVELPGGGDELPGETQLAQLDRLVNAHPSHSPKRRPDRILLSVGGNDSGFVGVLGTLVLPPGGYWVPFLGPILVGAAAEATCPYRDTGPPLSRLCRGGDSAEVRLEQRLPPAYDGLAGRLSRRGWQAVYHFAYPNPMLDRNGEPCDVRAVRDPRTLETMNGFEALMGHLARPVRGFRYTWDFELQYYPEAHLHSGERLFPTAACDNVPEPGDSEVCQGLWIHSRLNRRVAENETRPGWAVVDSHVAAIAGHGLCVRDQASPSALPRVIRGSWLEDWTPQSYRPYDAADDRWFRTPNDSIVTQYGDSDHFHHGSFHPTLSAHLAYAQAALTEALMDGR